MKKEILAIVLVLIICCIAQACKPSFFEFTNTVDTQSIVNEDNFNASIDKYFKDRLGNHVTVKYKLLRKFGTETGIAFPKFYVWIEVYKNDEIIEDGVARVAVTDEKEVNITHYLNRAEIKNNSEKVFAIFPRDVGITIIDKAEN